MLNKQLRKQNEKGFTIIEVLIVLAIAALILLIVFLAVPALQRSARNNSRKNDASRVSAAFANFVSNNNGTLPGAETTLSGATFNTDCGPILSDIGNLGAYKLACSATVSGTVANGEIALGSVTPGGLTVTSAGAVDGIIYVEGASCPSTTSSTGTSLILPAGNLRQSVTIYTLETSSGNYNLGCIQST
jgi:prepilin-type N-terminal cleavage/methylation domain-containing protein